MTRDDGAARGSTVRALRPGPLWAHRMVRLHEWVRDRFWSIPVVLVIAGVVIALWR